MRTNLSPDPSRGDELGRPDRDPRRGSRPARGRRRPRPLHHAARRPAARARQRSAGVVYIAVTTFGLEARDCAERLRRGDRIGVTGRIEQDKHRTPEGWRVDHSVLIDQLDLPTGTTNQREEENR
jgi:hypothetical protein